MRRAPGVVGGHAGPARERVKARLSSVQSKLKFKETSSRVLESDSKSNCPRDFRSNYLTHTCQGVAKGNFSPVGPERVYEER